MRGIGEARRLGGLGRLDPGLRQDQLHGRAAAELALDVEPAAEQGHQTAHEIEANSRTVVSPVEVTAPPVSQPAATAVALTPAFTG